MVNLRTELSGSSDMDPGLRRDGAVCFRVVAELARSLCLLGRVSFCPVQTRDCVWSVPNLGIEF